MRHRESEDTFPRSSERDDTHQAEITSTSYRLKNDFLRRRRDAGVEKTGAQFGKNDQSNSGSYRKPGYVYGKVLRHEAEVRSVSSPPCTPKPER